MNFTSTPSHSRRINLVLTLAGLIGILLFVALYDQAFPEAAIDLTLSRSELEQRATAYLQAQGYAVAQYESALTFYESSFASTYLQRTFGVAEANRRIRADRLPIWSWSMRWFKPLQQEGFTLDLQPDGEVIGFSHTITEDLAGAQLTEDQARLIAEGYLTQDRHWTLTDWEPVSASSEQQPSGRIDHSFEWKRRDYPIGEGDLRLDVDIQGDRVGSYSYWVRVPDAFGRTFSEQRSWAGFINNLSYTLGFVIFEYIALAACLFSLWRGLSAWRNTRQVAILVGVIGLLAALNYLPLDKAGYGTTQNYILFWVQDIFDTVFGAIYRMGFIVLMLVGAYSVGRQVWPQQDMILARGEDRWIAFSRSAWRGLMLGGLHVGYVVLFYLFATRVLGWWIPLDSPDSNLYATPLPFMGPLQSGLMPALQEELLFRLIGIAVILRLTRRRWLAVLIPAVLWAFAHTAYLTDPIYLRGIELTIVGIVYGVIFLRYGLMTTIIAHFAYNASLGTLPLLRSGNSYFILCGLIVVATMLVPVVPGVIKLILRRMRRDSHNLLPQIGVVDRADLPGLSALAIQDLDWSALLDDPAVLIVCLKVNAEVVGVAAGRTKGKGTVELLITHIVPRWRRQYWGSRLMAEFGAQLKTRDTESVEVTVGRKDEIAIAFWASQNWRQKVKVYSRSLLPALKPDHPTLAVRLRAIVESYSSQ